MAARLRRLGLAILILAVFPVAWAIQPYASDSISVCFFRTWTGYPCPFCGLTRAMAAAMHGRWRLAWRLNPLWSLAAAILLAIATSAILDLITGKDRLGKFRAMSSRFTWPRIIAAMAFLWTVKLLAH